MVIGELSRAVRSEGDIRIRARHEVRVNLEHRLGQRRERVGLDRANRVLECRAIITVLVDRDLHKAPVVFWIEDAEAETDPVFGEGARGCVGRAVCVRSVHNVRDNISGRGHARYLVGTEGVATDVFAVVVAIVDLVEDLRTSQLKSSGSD